MAYVLSYKSNLTDFKLDQLPIFYYMIKFHALKETRYMSGISFSPVQWTHQSDIAEEKPTKTFSMISISKEEMLFFSSKLR